MRKIRGKDLYKVWNSATGEVKSSGSTKADAKAQMRLLRSLEKKEAGSLKADQIKDVIDLSYNNKKDKAPDGYVIDKELSDGRVKVYKDLNSKQVIVAHRGSSGWKDWLDNAYYATTGNIKSSGTYKTHKKKHEKALDKYGADNVISVGHSRAGKYVEELNKEKPVKEVLTYNKAVGLHDAFQKNPKNQTDIRSSRDAVSFLAPLQRSANKVVNISSNTLNPLKAHGTSALSSLGNKLIGKGFKQMRVGDMRKFAKAFKKAKYGEKMTGGAKLSKKELTEMIKPMLEDDDIDEMVGGSVWTDFVKEFSAKHSLKYACSLSKYKEPLKKAYRLFKEKKDWYEPFKIDAISEASIVPVAKAKDPEPNISLTIAEKEEGEIPIYNENRDSASEREKVLQGFSADKLRSFLLNQHSHQAKENATAKELALDILLVEVGLVPQISKPLSKSAPPSVSKPLPPLISEREAILLTYNIADLKDVLAGYKIKGVSKMKKADMIKAILAFQNIPEGVKWGDKAWIYNSLKSAHACLDDKDISGLRQSKYALEKAKEKLEAGKGGKMDRQAYTLLQNNIERYKERIAECEALLKRDFQKEYSGSGVLSGGNKWTDFVKDYAKSYNTTYGCALSDMGIKQAYRLFKDGKEWYFPKVSASIETQTDDDFVEPEPEKAPVNIEPVVNRIEEKIKELERVGAEKGAVSYNPATIITDLMFVNLMKKFGGRCIVNNVMKKDGIELGININSKKDMTSIRFVQIYEILGEKLAECISRGVSLILIPLSFQFGSSLAGHANMLVYRPFKRLVERYEPHGVAYGNSMVDNASFNEQLKQLWEKDLTPYIGEVRYRPPDDYCPNPRGFQDLEGGLDGLKLEGGGFCSMWSFFVAELTFLNPDKSTREILEEVYDISKSEPAYLKSVIRGYVVEAERELDILLKSIGKAGFTFKTKRGMHPAMTIQGYNPTKRLPDGSRTAGDLDMWILSVVFDSKKYSEAPPDFEPLPDVIIKGKDDKEKLKDTYFDKLRGLTKDELKNIWSIYGRKVSSSVKRDDVANFLLTNLISGDFDKYGANDITDIDVILEEELHKKKGAFKSGLARTGYFKNKKEGGSTYAQRLARRTKNTFKPVGKAFDKAGSDLTKGAFAVSQGLNKINPMMLALNDKRTSKGMADLGEVTNDYLLPAVVSAGKPVYDATAMGASTLLTGNPILGKAVADSLWDNMVANRGIDPRDRQKSQALGTTSGLIGNVLGKASGKMF